MNLRALVAFLTALTLADPVFGAPGVAFVEDVILGVEGRSAPLDIVATDITEPLEVKVEYVFATSNRRHEEHYTLTPSFPRARTEVWIHDNLYSGLHHGVASLWYRDPTTGADVGKAIPMRFEDDEPRPRVIVDPQRFVTSGVDRVHVIPIRLTNPAAFPMTFRVNTSDRTATFPDDYYFFYTNSDCRFPAGEVTCDVSLRVVGDDLHEGSETFDLLVEWGIEASATIQLIDLQTFLAPQAQFVMAGDRAELDLVTDGPVEWAGAQATILTTDPSVASAVHDTVQIPTGRASADVVLRTDAPGEVTITADFPPADGLPSASATVHVYGSEIRLSPETIALEPGATARIEIQMQPPPPDVLLLPLSSRRPGTVTADSTVTVDTTGAATFEVRGVAAGRGAVDVVSPGGRQVATVEVEVGTPWVVNGLLPSEGSTAGGTVVILSGQGFQHPCSVRFGENEASAVTVVDGTTIRALTPPHRPEKVDVSVTCANSTRTVLDAFNYRPGRSRAVRH